MPVQHWWEETTARDGWSIRMKLRGLCRLSLMAKHMLFLTCSSIPRHCSVGSFAGTFYEQNNFNVSRAFYVNF